MSWCLNVLNKPSNQDLLKTIFQNIDVPGVRKNKKKHSKPPQGGA
jgi:hypothetical protein